MRRRQPQDDYLSDPDWLEARIGLPPLHDLVVPERARGATRLVVLDSFEPERFITCVFGSRKLKVELATAKQSVWHSLGQSPCETGVDRIEKGVPQRKAPADFTDFDCLMNKVARATSCSTQCLDGVFYRHRLYCPTAEFYAEWHNPDEREHQQQYELLREYSLLLRAASIGARFLPVPARRWWPFWR